VPSQIDEGRREELLDGLEAIMLTEGFSHLRVGGLAARLHCSRSTLYKLAPSKTELFALVFERFVDKAIRQADDRARRLDSTAEKVVRNIETISEWVTKGSEIFWREVRDTPEMADVTSSQRGRGYRIIQGYLDEGIAAGEVRPMSTEFVAYVIWMTGVAMRDPDRMRQLGIGASEAHAEFAQLVAKGISP
jgi:AcrR family transcriptional regulator